jgi:hypothetical protein
MGVAVQALVAVEDVLERVVGRVADVGLGIDDEPGFALGGQYVAGVRSVHNNADRSAEAGNARNNATPSRARPGSRSPRVFVVLASNWLAQASHIACKGVKP